MFNYPFDCISEFVFVNSHVEAADIILVPGSSKPQSMIKAVELYHMGVAPYILPSGGYNEKIGECPSEWEFLRRKALALGVPDIAILKEDQARNTFENARFSLKLLQDRGIPYKKVVLVCKAYHSRRALLTYMAVFPKDTVFYTCTVADYRGIQKHNWYTKEEWTHVVMSEVVKIGKYFEKEIPELMRKGNSWPVLELQEDGNEQNSGNR